MQVITEEILDQAIAAAKLGHLDDLTYYQSAWCGTSCCVLGFARHLAGSEEINAGPQEGEIVDTPRAQTIRALMSSASPSILDVMAAVQSDGSLPAGFTVGGNLSLRGCASLTALPAGFTVGGNLTLCDCASLTALPAGLTVGRNLYLFGCPATIPPSAKIGGHIYR